MTDGRVVVRHANVSWSFQLTDEMGRAASPGHHGRAEGRYMPPKAGKTFSSARGYHCVQAPGEDGLFGQYLYVRTHMNRSQTLWP
jgi:hypothetical protein